MGIGRPPKPNKLTSAEKSKRYRHQKKEHIEELERSLASLRAEKTAEIQDLRAQVASYRMKYEIAQAELAATQHALKILRDSHARRKESLPKIEPENDTKNGQKKTPSGVATESPLRIATKSSEEL